MWFLLGFLLGVSTKVEPVWFHHSSPGIPWWVFGLAFALALGFVVLFLSASTEQKRAYDRAVRSARRDFAEMKRRGGVV